MSRIGVRNATEGDADGITRLLADLGCDEYRKRYVKSLPTSGKTHDNIPIS